ncbi:MAG: hypothetical protein HXX10_16345 [Rhodoplanes sp.]|uniref:hypothetical protein n=1 Tax=Rhodoplanes sp. TaxID=1968906 RepID=UPI001848E528|nr:hypothetical protein [Rhodoplanes sp.]NVO15603.1 hypothetical protein [Rhodoplanes sp.]
MIRSSLEKAAVVAAGAVAAGMLAGTAVLAQAPPLPPDADTSRFGYHRTADGFARLDLRTGQVSLCTLRASGWACQAAPDDRSAFEAEISRLQAENVALKKALLERGLPLPGGVSPQAAAPPPDAGRSADADLDRALSFVERAWRRLIEMMNNLQRDLGKT